MSSADGEKTLPEQIDTTASGLAEARGNRIALLRELHVLEDALAEARSTALENEQAARAARFRTVAEAEAHLTAELRLAEIAQQHAELTQQLSDVQEQLRASREQLRDIRTSKAFRFSRALGAFGRRARKGSRSSG